MKKQIVMLVLAVLCITSTMAQTVVVDDEIFLVVDFYHRYTNDN